MYLHLFVPERLGTDVFASLSDDPERLLGHVCGTGDGSLFLIPSLEHTCWVLVILTGSQLCLKCILRPLISLCAVRHGDVRTHRNLAGLFANGSHSCVFGLMIYVCFCRAAHVTSADRRLWTRRRSAGTRTVRGSKGSSVGPACGTATERTSVQLC